MKTSEIALVTALAFVGHGQCATIRRNASNDAKTERALGKGKGHDDYDYDYDDDEYYHHQPHASPMNLQCVVAEDESPAMPGAKSRFCMDKGLEINEESIALLGQVPGASEFLKYFEQYKAEGYTIGSITDLIVEAGDAAKTGAPVEDGKSGDINFPYGEIKSIVTVGERSVCEESYGETMVGWPDGMGAYLLDDETVRVVYQSESYGPLRTNEAWAYPVNNGAALIGGSHIQYVDYDRELFSQYMEKTYPASHMVVGAGQHIKKAYNLKGEPLGRRNREGPTEVGAQYGCTNAAGDWVVKSTRDNPNGLLSFPRIEYDWFYQSFCSAHMEEAHQWGPGIGFEDDLFMTNEEWHNYDDENTFVGCTYHCLDVKHDTIYAVGAMSAGGFEKSSEINPQNTDYVMIAMSGYNGDYSGRTATLQARKDAYGNVRPDGKNWTWPENIHPARFYLGIKGLKEDGTKAKESDFLARNGLKYGQIYGYTIDMTENGPTGGKWRDEAHKGAPNGFKVPGFWKAQPWRWDGTVRDFQHDGSWDFQVAFDQEEGWEGYAWWNANGYDADGAKCEHLSPDIRPGKTGFIQGSTAGYFGHYYVKDVDAILDAMDASNGELPKYFPGEYYVYQGENDIRDQIELGGKGKYTDAPTGEKRDATCNFDSVNGEDPGCTKNTFEDIDGFEYFCGSDCCRAILQEDSGNDLGERCFITSCLEHEGDGKELTYYLVAVSGGVENTRMKHKVGIPKGSNKQESAHEFSGVFDLSGLLLKDDHGDFTLKANDPGYKKRMEEAKVCTNDKYIMINVQAGNMNDRIVVEFGSDSGGQVMVYKPRLPDAH